MRESNLMAALILRLGIGFYLILLGLWGYTEPELSLKAMQAYAHLPQWYSSIFIDIAPYFLFLCGIFLVVGVLTSYAALFAALMLLPLFFGAGAFTPTDNLHALIQKRMIYKDLVIFVGCISIYFGGAGAFSLDRVLIGLYGSKTKD